MLAARIDTLLAVIIINNCTNANGGIRLCTILVLKSMRMRDPSIRQKTHANLFLLFRSMPNDTFVWRFTLSYSTIFIIIICSIWSCCVRIALSKNNQIRNVELFTCSFIDIFVMIAKMIALLLSREFRRSDFEEHEYRQKSTELHRRTHLGEKFY